MPNGRDRYDSPDTHSFDHQSRVDYGEMFRTLVDAVVQLSSQQQSSAQEAAFDATAAIGVADTKGDKMVMAEIVKSYTELSKKRWEAKEKYFDSFAQMNGLYEMICFSRQRKMKESVQYSEEMTASLHEDIGKMVTLTSLLGQAFKSSNTQKIATILGVFEKSMMAPGGFNSQQLTQLLKQMVPPK